MLVAVSIPIFTAQLEKSREATDLANVRSAYAEQMAAYLTSDNKTAIADITVPAKQTIDKWQSLSGEPANATIAEGKTGSAGKIDVPCHLSGSNYTIKVDQATGKITIS